MMKQPNLKYTQNNKSNLSRLSFLATVIVSTLLLIFLLFLAFSKNMDVSKARSDIGFYVITDVEQQERTDDSAPIGIRKEYSFTLPDEIPADQSLAFYVVHQMVTVYLDEENIYSLRQTDTGWHDKTVGSNWVIVPIYREDAGRKVRIEVSPVYENFQNWQIEFLFGSELAIYKDRLTKDLPQLLLGIMAVFTGLMFLLVAIYNLLKKKRGQNLAALGFFSVIVGFWRLTDTRFSPFILPDKPVLLFSTSVSMMMLGSLAVMYWIKGYFNRKSQRIMDGYCILTALVLVMQVALQAAGILDLRETLPVTHMFIALGAAIIGGVILYERKYYSGHRKIMMGKMLPLLCVAGVVSDVVIYYAKGNSSGLMGSLTGFLLYIVFMGISTMFNFSEQELELAEKDLMLAEQERKLTERRISTMMSQIRSHFIFNVLTTISGYCKIDPKKADTALIRFSRYLRKNIRIIEEEGLISFTMELEQLEDYVALEQMRFPGVITFETDIQTTSFQIPPLTIQPLVENAIKHGLVECGKRGTIHLMTRRDKDGVEVVVADNGIGFDVTECEDKDSVGIRNTRYRIENMVQGSLSIQSTPGEGTTATIRIP